MAWEDQQRKRILALAAQTEARNKKRNKALLRAIIVLLLFGVALVVVDNVFRSKGALVPIDFKDQPGTVALWLKTGFLKSIDEATGDVNVDEVVWRKMAVGERHAVGMLLASYCAAKTHKPNYALTLRGNVSNKVLGTIDGKKISIK